MLVQEGMKQTISNEKQFTNSFINAYTIIRYDIH